MPASEAYEHSELLMYKAQVLAEGGQQAAALALLDAEQVRQQHDRRHTCRCSMAEVATPGLDALTAVTQLAGGLWSTAVVGS